MDTLVEELLHTPTVASFDEPAVGCCRQNDGSDGSDYTMVANLAKDQSSKCRDICADTANCRAYQLRTKLWAGQVQGYDCEIHQTTMPLTKQGHHCKQMQCVNKIGGAAGTNTYQKASHENGAPAVGAGGGSPGVSTAAVAAPVAAGVLLVVAAALAVAVARSRSSREIEGQTEGLDWDADDLGTKLATECSNGASIMDTTQAHRITTV